MLFESLQLLIVLSLSVILTAVLIESAGLGNDAIVGSIDFIILNTGLLELMPTLLIVLPLLFTLLLAISVISL